MAETTDQSPHNPELQSLRGIAAVLVMVHHGLRTLQPAGWAWNISEFLLNAHGAVVVFFVLSGYVLSRSLARRGLDARGTAVFYVRRLFRIYPALWVGVVLGAAYLMFVEPLDAAHLSAWMHGHYQPELLSASKVAQSVAGLDGYLLPTGWTITVELCGSAILPFIVFGMVRWPASTLPLLLLLTVVAAVAGPAARQVPFFMVDFALGAALACLPAARRLRPGSIAMAAALVVLLFAHVVIRPEERHMWSISMLEGLSSAVLIAGLVAGRARWMQHRSLIAIGDWSYGIYLLHLPIAFALARGLDHARIVSGDHNWWALAIAVATSAIVVPLSMLVHRFVELPGIALGARTARLLVARPPATVPAVLTPE